METKKDLQNLTVAVLKEKLKQRSLTTTGTKSELIDRLYESYQEEENLLVGSGETGDLDEDELLNLAEPSLTSNEEALLLGLPSKTQGSKTSESQKNNTAQKTEPAAPKVSPAKPVASQASAKVEITSPTNGTNDDKKVEESKPARQPIRPKISTENVDELKKKRSERFGITAEKSAEAKPSVSEADKHPVSLTSNTKLLERAKRFGLPVQAGDNDASNGASKPKVARLSTDLDDAKKRRLERFGQK